MEKRAQNRLISTYLILAIVLVCSALILLDLYNNVDEVAVFPWEGPTPTPTLWWRTPQTATPAVPTPAALSAPATEIGPGAPVPAAGSALELIDD